MSYHTYYGMTDKPFRKDLPVHQLYESEDLKAFLARMEYLKQIKGLAVAYGRPGMGKTTALRAFVEGLNTQLFHVVYRVLSAVTVLEFYRGLCQALHLEPAYKKVDMFAQIQDRIQTLAGQKKQTPFFIFDEAQFLSQAILNELRMLFNFHMDSKDYCMVLLCGQNFLVNQLNYHANEPLRQRVMVHYEFTGLTEAEVPAYVETLLGHVGVEEPLFTADALTALAGLCGGSPRVLTHLLDKALILGYQNKTRSLDAEIVRQAHEASALFAS